MKGKKCSTAIYTMLFAILGILWLALPGCSETVPELLANPPQIPQSFTCEIQFSMEGLEGSAHLERPGRSGELQPPSAAPLNPDSGLEICFSAPETLAGVSILCLEDISQVQIGSVTADFLTSSDGQNNALPNGSLLPFPPSHGKTGPRRRIPATGFLLGTLPETWKPPPPMRGASGSLSPTTASLLRSPSMMLGFPFNFLRYVLCYKLFSNIFGMFILPGSGQQ